MRGDKTRQQNGAETAATTDSDRQLQGSDEGRQNNEKTANRSRGSGNNNRQRETTAGERRGQTKYRKDS